MSRVRLRVSHRDQNLVVAQGASTRSYRPFCQTFGASADRKAALIVRAVNCHGVLVKALEACQRTAQRGNGSRAQTRLALIVSYTKLALRRIEE